MQKMNEVLLKLPKSELHLHLRGAIPIELFTDLLNKYPVKDALKEAPPIHKKTFKRYDNISPFLLPQDWSVDEVSRLFNYNSFEQFLWTWCFTEYFIRDLSDLKRLVKNVVEKLRMQNVVYAEISVSVIFLFTKEFLNLFIT